ncbi:TonB-dependent siderophore receptor [Phenylobacterium sp.]|uniref:TonB-dependent receptor plug domain-containing protein n=1 Tax=Phenylobacterium sp. TaxID=1871053 RepID=UPI0025FA6B45|nr:TonB-dependent receptor [Phenylobacterium sp.]MBX3484097.1 TonB-dependent receptor [Phenylobacterium sp.]
MSSIRSCAVAALLLVPLAAHAQEGPVTAYPAAFFAPAQPYSAFDMLQRLPGFTFDPGDAEVRGFGGASGNVLIDGKRPTSKQEGLEAILRRIPARSVERIELVRAGAAGFDLQGRPLVANVVRRGEAVMRGRVEAGLGAYPGERQAPRFAGEVSRRSGERLLEASASVAREIDAEKGEGPRDRIDPFGAPLRHATYRENKWTDVAEGAAGYEQGLAGGKLRLDASVRAERKRANILETATFPAPSAEVVGERENVTEGELGGHYERALVGPWALEALALGRWSRTRARDQADEGPDREVARVALDARESIVRAVARRAGPATTLEIGGEAALNTLASRNGLSENGIDVDLPAARVRVEERRAEGFATLTWRPRPSLTVEAGGRIEVSRLTQSGDASLAKTLLYPKPRALVSWRPTAHDELRLAIERRVGQLDFEDFVSSASLTSNTVTAGNPDLEPDRAWRTSLTWERRFGGVGSLVATLRHDEIGGVVDRVPVVGPGYAFDAPGNIGRGVRDEAQVAVTAPLDRLGLSGVVVKSDVTWRRSRVTDPATGVSRGISGEPDFQGAIHLTQDLPRWRARWGVDAVLAQTKVEYLFNEVKTDRVDTRLGLFAEYRPTPAWNIRVQADNLTDGKVYRRREQYGGVRGAAPLRRIETRAMDFGPFVSVTVQRAFAGGAR